MNRQTRIRVVAVSGLALFAIFVAFIGAPLIAVAFWPSQDLSSSNIETVTESIAQITQAARIANNVSMIALAVAGVCILYLLVVLAGWFIGPKDAARNA